MDEIQALRETIKNMAAEHDDIRLSARWSLAFEIGKMLKARGAWCPPLSPVKDNYADIITALGIEFEKLDERITTAST